jgi:Trp operon repressor
MTHVSRKQIDLKTLQILNKALIAVFSDLTFAETHSTMNVLLTKTEKMMLLKRLGILYLLQEDLSQEEIALILKTTRQTVARIELQLLKIPDDDKRLVRKKLSSWRHYTKLKEVLKNAAVWSVKKVLRASVGRT